MRALWVLLAACGFHPATTNEQIDSAMPGLKATQESDVATMRIPCNGMHRL